MEKYKTYDHTEIIEILRGELKKNNNEYKFSFRILSDFDALSLVNKIIGKYSIWVYSLDNNTEKFENIITFIKSNETNLGMHIDDINESIIATEIIIYIIEMYVSERILILKNDNIYLISAEDAELEKTEENDLYLKLKYNISDPLEIWKGTE